MNKKIALVTGGSRGLGKDMALSFAKKGIDVILTYNTGKDQADETIALIEAFNQQAASLHFDISDIQSIDGFLLSLQEILQQKWQVNSLDFVVHNAGVGATLMIPEVTESDFDRLLNIHFKGVYFLTQKLMPMVNDRGSVIFISSGTTRFCVPGYSVYSSMKGAVEIFSKYVAKEFGTRGIRSNVVAPGATETDFNSAAIRNNPQMKNFLAAQTALGRVGQANDIGSVVAFLCSEEAGWINGQRIEVSGGINL